jgi:hypothetical protein
MFNLGIIWASGLIRNNKDQCGPFHSWLEALQLSPDSKVDRFYVLAQLPVVAREHAKVCAACMEAVEDFAAMRNLLLPFPAESAPAPGPWFSAKVINAIVAQEAEANRSDTVWDGVRNLAPRLAAFSALLLVIAGTWAFQMKQQVQNRQVIRPAETMFEPSSSAPLNDDVMASIGERR